MLVIALVAAGLLLVLTNIGVRSKSPVGYTLGLGLVFSLLPAGMGLVLFPVWELAIAFFILSLVLVAIDRKRLFLPASMAIAVIVFGLNSWWAWHQADRLRQTYPFESMEGRLPERAVSPESFLSAKTRSLAIWEREIEDSSSENGRTYVLRELHEDAVKMFIKRPNFGAARMTGMEEWILQRFERDNQPIPQQGERSASAGEWDEMGRPALGDEELRAMHKAGTIDFLHPNGFGYIKDRRHVAGFQPHQFSRAPEVKRWRLQTLDLVGLVMHSKPVAYISSDLPRMDELRKAPTRDLNAFETAGLTALRGGEDLYVREMPDGKLRMLGPLRALKQCVECHGGARGDLLGAFSYELRPAEAK